nr:Na+/H+ antiporter NhaA [sulfur-oxidizing endosymbiont of Gigantopelta aegis]
MHSSNKRPIDSQSVQNNSISFLQRFFKKESASSILLISAAILAIIVANSPLSSFYGELLDIPVEIRIGALHIAKPLILWINDGLMAIFFFFNWLGTEKRTFRR